MKQIAIRFIVVEKKMGMIKLIGIQIIYYNMIEKYVYLT